MQRIYGTQKILGRMLDLVKPIQKKYRKLIKFTYRRTVVTVRETEREKQINDTIASLAAGVPIHRN
jgi:hypothetical protein